MAEQTVLVVDDEPANLALMLETLAGSYRLVFASDGAETLRAIAKHQPALVLLDVDLPDTNGYDLCRKIKQLDSTQSVQVIFVTGFTDPEHEALGFEAGGVDYIVKPISPVLVRARVAAHLSLVRADALEQSYREAILMLGHAGHYNDSFTGAHIWRMAAYAKEIALASGWGAERSLQLELAAPMHDTGKLGVPQAILCKPGPLDAAEWEVMKRHTRVGHDILTKSEAPVFLLAAEIALHHHEKWDGSGYPDGLRGEAIPESARIVALADVFDALSMTRPYKGPWPLARIVDTINLGAGVHFDPDLVRIFTSILPRLLEIRDRWAKVEQTGAEVAVQG